MAIYDFECNECEEVHEENIPMSEAESEMEFECEKCGKPTIHKKLIGGAGFVLKGEGWAADGYQHEYTDCKANAAGKGKKCQVLRHRNLDKKLKKRGFLADEEK